MSFLFSLVKASEVGSKLSGVVSLNQSNLLLLQLKERFLQIWSSWSYFVSVAGWRLTEEEGDNLEAKHLDTEEYNLGARLRHVVVNIEQKR